MAQDMSQYIEEIVIKTVDTLRRQGLLKDVENVKYSDASEILRGYYKGGEKDNSITYAIQAYRFDPYFAIIPLYFREKKTLEAIAEKLGVDVSTIVRNKRRLCLSIYEEIS